MKKKMIPVLLAIVLIFLVIAIAFGGKILEKYSYSKERADLNSYFDITQDNEVAIILQDEIVEEKIEGSSKRNNIQAETKKVKDHLEGIFGEGSEEVIANARYAFIGGLMAEAVKRPEVEKETTTDKIDKIVTNRVLALPIFAGVMFLMYAIAMGSYILCASIYQFASGSRITAYSLGLLILSLVIAAGFARSGDGFVKFIMLLFLTLHYFSLRKRISLNGILLVQSQMEN